MLVPAYAAPAAGKPLERVRVRRRPVGERDVLIEIAYTGLCHSDLHQVRGDWGSGLFPMVPGHEIAGVVAEAGARVTRFAVGDRVGVGCFVDSCRECAPCRAGREQHCAEGMTSTYNAVDRRGEHTYGGYSTHVVVDERYVLALPDSLGLAEAAPLLCAGVTVHRPLRRWGVGPGTRVAVVGLGGLGHLAVRTARALGAEVSVLSRTNRKRDDALLLGACEFHPTEDPAVFDQLARTFDLVLCTTSDLPRLDPYVLLLALDGVLVHVGIPSWPSMLSVAALLDGERTVSGSFIGGLGQAQEALDFFGREGIGAAVETVGADRLDEAYARLAEGDVRFRFVLDAASIR